MIMKMVKKVLKNELLSANSEDVKGQCDDRGVLTSLEGMKPFQVK
jgi:hypothetical protein